MTNKQLSALWDVVTEMGDDGQKGYIAREVSYIIKIDPNGEIIRDVAFVRGTHGAIVHKDRSGRVDGELYSSKGALDRAWKATNAKTGIPPWKK